ncbi:MAG TPA: hypothetical protein VIC08_08920, partial [Cellvibrionaceae bacterium]
ASLLGYFLCMFLGIGTIIIFETFCPEQDLVSEVCTAAYMGAVENIALFIFSSLAAVLVVLLASLAAPTHKFVVACIAYTLGAITAITMGLSIGAYSILAATLISGAIILYVIYRVVSMPENNVADC